MEHLVKIKKPSTSDIVTMDDLVNLIKGALAAHYCVKYNWDYNDVDMKKHYEKGSLEDALQSINRTMKQTKQRDDESIFIDTIKEECEEWCCIDFCSPIIFIRKTYIEEDFDGEQTKRTNEWFEYSQYFDNLATKNNYSIEREIMKRINYKEIVEFVKTHTDEEVEDKYSMDAEQKEEFWFHYT